MKKAAIVAMLATLVATPVLADNSGKFYTAVDLGKASYSNVGIPAVGGFPAADFPNPGMVAIGAGYHFNQAWAAEVKYSMFGDSSLDYAGVGKATLAMSSIQIAAINTMPLSQKFDFIAKLGFASNSAKLTGTNAFSNINTSISSTDVLFGLGVQYNINEKMTVRVQYESLGKFGPATNDPKANAISLGLVTNF